MLEKRGLLLKKLCGNNVVSLSSLACWYWEKIEFRDSGSEETKNDNNDDTEKSKKRDVCCAVTNYQYTRWHTTDAQTDGGTVRVDKRWVRDTPAECLLLKRCIEMLECSGHRDARRPHDGRLGRGRAECYARRTGRRNSNRRKAARRRRRIVQRRHHRRKRIDRRRRQIDVTKPDSTPQANY